MTTTPQDKARRYVRTAMLIGLVAPGFEYARFLFASWGAGPYFEFSAILGFVGFAFGVPLAWLLILPAIKAASTLLYRVFGREVSHDDWQVAAYRAFWTLPIAAALGGVTWLVYSLGKFGRWPDDVIFGAIANLLGAWCYGTIFWNWFQLRRKPCAADDVATFKV